MEENFFSSIDLPSNFTFGVIFNTFGVIGNTLRVFFNTPALFPNKRAFLYDNQPLFGNKWHLSFVKTTFSKNGGYVEEKKFSSIVWNANRYRRCRIFDGSGRDFMIFYLNHHRTASCQKYFICTH